MKISAAAGMKGFAQILPSKGGLSVKWSRMIHNMKVTVLCGLTTLLVLRGTIGGTGGVEHAPVDGIRSLEAAEVVPGYYWDPAVPFRLGPKISNWDQQRATWSRDHPGANVTQRGTPRVLLVTGSQPTQCANPVGSFQLLKSLKNKVDYCRLHDIELFYNLAHLDPHMTSFWAKLPLLRKLMLAHPEVEWLWWMDSDALFTDMTREIPLDSYSNYNLIINGNGRDVYEKKSWLGVNAGIFLVRNCQWTLDLFDEWALMGPEGPVRDAGGKVQAAGLSDRPDYEADDQSALVLLLNQDPVRWGARTRLELDLGLHGYWNMIVEKYEEMMATTKSSASSWPFVTHFVGCKPCSSGDGTGTYAVDRCLNHMERAFNFADNQVLKLYGYRHTSLNTHAVHRVTSEPLKPA